MSTPFEGRPIEATKIKIPGSAVILLNGAELVQGTTVYVLGELEVDEIRFPRVLNQGADTGSDDRVQTTKVKQMMLVDARFAKPFLDEERERRRTADEERAGITHLRGTVPAADGTDDVMSEAEAFHHHHLAGRHDDGRVEGCPDCELLEELGE